MTRIGRSGTVALGCLAAFVLLTLALIGGPLPRLDESVRHWAVVHQDPGVRRLAVDARWVGNAWVAGPALAAATAATAWRTKRWRLLVLTLGLAACVAVAVVVLKVVVGRSDAPFAAHARLGAGGRSYPSGHVATAAACWGLAAAVIAAHAHKLRIVAATAAVALTVVEGWSVVYGPSHWLTDAIGAVLLGVAAVAAWTALGGVRLSRHRRS
jgi:membrane-associated phospholipid phosphatase